MSLEATGFTRLQLRVRRRGYSSEEARREENLPQQLETASLCWGVERLFPREDACRKIWREYC